MKLSIDEVMGSKRLHRRVTGVAAALLPFEVSGVIAADAFAAHLKHTDSCGLVNAINMDTGYVNLLSVDEKRTVLGIAREALGPDVRALAGVYVEGQDGDLADLYRREIGVAAGYGFVPVLFQSTRMHAMSGRQKASIYRLACSDVEEALAFELSSVFAPNGQIWDDETFTRMLNIPQLSGAKHSSLDRLVELKRLRVRDAVRPEFKIYTGNDLGIDMIEYGSDYLLGLATFCPEAFAARDKAWESGNADYYSLADALQNLGNIAFRAPVPAYKHSAALFLHAAGKIPTGLTHPSSPRRPQWEAEIMDACLTRINSVLTMHPISHRDR